MNMIKKVLGLVLSLLMLAGCAYSPDGVATTMQSQAQLLEEIQAISVEEWKPSIWNRINKSTYVLLASMGDSVSDDKKEDLSKIVRGHFVEDMKIRQSLTQAVLIQDDQKAKSNMIRSHLDLRLQIASNTKTHVKDLLDRKGYRQFQKSLDPFLPRQRVPTTFRDYSGGVNDNWPGNPESGDIGQSHWGQIHGDH